MTSYIYISASLHVLTYKSHGQNQAFSHKSQQMNIIYKMHCPIHTDDHTTKTWLGHTLARGQGPSNY